MLFTFYFYQLKTTMKIRLSHISILLMAAFCLLNELPVTAATSTEMYATLARKKKRNKKKADKTEKPPASDYKKITGRDSVALKGVVNIFHKEDSWYMELPVALMGREFLVANRLQKVPKELNEAGVNKGINYENQVVTFEWLPTEKKVNIRQQYLTPEVSPTDQMALSVKNNYINPLIASLKVEALSTDSSTVIVKVEDLFNGKKTSINDVFNNINLGTSASSELSRILSIKAFESNITATSELTTTVHEGMSKVNITVVVSSSLCLLPEEPMQGRTESARIGYFTTARLQYGDKQQNVKHQRYITRWRLEPTDKEAYLRGELTTPVKPITFYLDPATPSHLRPFIKKGILDWNKAFEKAGFKDAVRVADYTDSLEAEGDDIKYSVFTYAASTKANAMGPSIIDPRTGEILEADIIWWHNVVSLLREWLVVQTGAANPDVRGMAIPDSLIGDAARFVACHEVGHSLGLRHNMIASSAYPTDSLRSAAFARRVGGTSASIMDYARFNYVAQPGDGTQYMSPHIGPYDLLAIEWGYRWFADKTSETKVLNELLATHSGRLYKFSEAQPARSAVDPRALSEDLGDNAMLSAGYGIANLKRIVPDIIKWTTNGEQGQTYEEAAKLYAAVIFQWNLYTYHVMANIGGIYLENTSVNDGEKTFTFVEKEKQRAALKFLLDEYITYPEWLFNTPISDYTYILKDTPVGVFEQSPNLLYKNALNYLLWDLLSNERLMRMFENEFKNGSKAFTAVEMMDILHQHIFAATIAGKKTDVMTRNLQKSFIDLIITSAAEQEGVKLNKHLYEHHFLLDEAEQSVCPEWTADNGERNGTIRTIDLSSTQVNRVSDALSVKRGELMRVLNLLKSKKNTSDLATRYHYEDMILRICTALGLTK